MRPWPSRGWGGAVAPKTNKEIRYVTILESARSKAGASGPFACWDFGFESRQSHGCLSLVSVVCWQVEVCLSLANHSSRGVLPTVVCLNVMKPRELGVRGPLGGCSDTEKRFT